MKKTANLLDVNLLNDSKKLALIDYWLKVINRPQGWHYDLDIIWILEELKKNNVEKGATILDAGAGFGITQFILASLGYNIISLDFSKRELPPFAKEIFDIQIIENPSFNYMHEYMNFVKYNAENRTTKVDEINNYNKLSKLKNILINQFFKLRNYFYYLNENNKNHVNYGTIKFIRAAFHNINLADNAVDAVVSVSAIEHADKSLLNINLNEFRRVVKKNGPILITTSVNDEDTKDTYHTKSKGICFSRKSIEDFSENIEFVNYDYQKVHSSLINSELFINRIDRYYVQDPLSDFFNKKIKSLPYLPVGIEIFKD